MVPPEYQRKLPHIEPGDRTVFITFCTAHRRILPERARSLVLDRCISGHRRFYGMHGCVVMPDHVHMVLTPLPRNEGDYFTLVEILKWIKGGAARAANKSMNRSGKLWQAESFDRILRQEESVREKLDYVCENPIRARLAKKLNEYPWIWRVWIDDPKYRGAPD